MKALIQKTKDDPYIEIVVMWTVRAIVVLACFTVIMEAFVVVGTLLGELVWIIIPFRK